MWPVVCVGCTSKSLSSEGDHFTSPDKNIIKRCSEAGLIGGENPGG